MGGSTETACAATGALWTWMTAATLPSTWQQRARLIRSACASAVVLLAATQLSPAWPSGSHASPGFFYPFTLQSVSSTTADDQSTDECSGFYRGKSNLKVSPGY